MVLRDGFGLGDPSRVCSKGTFSRTKKASVIHFSICALHIEQLGTLLKACTFFQLL